MKHKILVIDDEPQIRKILKITLEANNYTVLTAGTAAEGLLYCNTQPPAAVLLDLGLPDKDGLDVLKEVRHSGDIPVIILSVRSSDEDVVAALDLGANDYITKPFSVNILLARIRACLRNTSESETQVFNYNNLTVDFTAHTCTLSGEIIKLTQTEFQLLSLFITNRDKVLTHSFILNKIWGNSYSGRTQYLRVFVAALRKKIGDTNPRNRIIETESGVGYRMNAPADDDE